MRVQFRKLSETAKEPTRGSAGAAGYDLYAHIPFGGLVIPAGKAWAVHTGLAIQIPPGYFGGIYAKHGLATAYGLRPAMCTDVIPSGYPGEIIVVLYNDSDMEQYIEDGDKVAQLIIQPCADVEFEEAI